MNPGFRALLQVQLKPHGKGLQVGRGGREIFYPTPGSHSQSLRVELRPIIGSLQGASHTPLAKMQGWMMLERIGVQSGVRDRVLTCDSMTRIKGQAGIKLGGLF